jgi:hypothetical protein
MGKDARMTKTPAIQSPLGLPENQLIVSTKEELAYFLGIPVEQIELIAIESITWPDGSLGCPKPVC